MITLTKGYYELSGEDSINFINSILHPTNKEVENIRQKKERN